MKQTAEESKFCRTERLIGAEAMERLSLSRVAVFGIGGVGGHTAEALARSGIGALDLIDSDKVCLSNLNRQIAATLDTVGMYKVDAMAERIRRIHPDCNVRVHRCFFLPETAEEFDFSAYDYVVDAVDTVAAKLALAAAAQEAGTPIMSSMGAGNKLDPTRFEVADIYETSVCPLARVMRRELKKRGIERLKVVYSREEARKPFLSPEELETGTVQAGGARPRPVPGSNAFVPSVAGLILAGEVVCDLTGVRAR